MLEMNSMIEKRLSMDNMLSMAILSATISETKGVINKQTKNGRNIDDYHNIIESKSLSQ